MLRSLTARVVAGVALVIVTVFTSAGFIVVALTEHGDQRAADADLLRFAHSLAPSIAGTLAIPAPPRPASAPTAPLVFIGPTGTRSSVPTASPLPQVTSKAPNPGPARALVDAFDSRGQSSAPAGQIQFVRALNLHTGDRLIVGSVPPGFPRMRAQSGVRTLSVRGRSWRDLTTRLGIGLEIEVAGLASSIYARSSHVRSVVIWTGLGGLVVAFVATLLLPRVALHPLTRLARRVSGIAGTQDLSVRVHDAGEPREVAALSQELDHMLARLQAASSARESALLAARRFAADAGHELRTPLQSMRANLDIASSTEADAEQRATAIRTAITQSDRLARLADGLQVLARGSAGPSPGGMGEVDLGDIADGVVFAARTRHPDLGIEAVLPDAGPMLRGDADGLWRAIENLLENAARHGRAGGHVRLTVGGDDAQASVVVEDDGPGIPQTERAHVTERFVRGRHATAEGSGLGLAIVDAEARRHGGELTLADSELGGLLARMTLRR